MDKIEVENFLEKLTFKLMRKPTVKMWQACKWTIRNKQLSFEVNGLLFNGAVRIELNDKQNAYNIFFLGRFGAIDKYIPNVDGKNLVDVLDTHIENPKDGSYFKLVKQYARRNTPMRAIRRIGHG